jgi:hypothetical protein
MATAAKLRTPDGEMSQLQKRKPAQIEPELKAFLDAVIVPILVRKALAEIQREMG